MWLVRLHASGVTMVTLFRDYQGYIHSSGVTKAIPSLEVTKFILLRGYLNPRIEDTFSWSVVM